MALNLNWITTMTLLNIGPQSLLVVDSLHSLFKTIPAINGTFCLEYFAERID